MGGPLEDLVRIDLNLIPAAGTQRVDGRAVDALLQSRPPNGRCAHGTRLAVGVEAEVLKGLQRLGRRETVAARRAGQNRRAVADGRNFACFARISCGRVRAPDTIPCPVGFPASNT